MQSQAAFRTLNRFLEPAVRAGLGSPLPFGLGLVVVETTGRKSGKTRAVPLVALRTGDRVTVSTVRKNSQWVKNLEADNRARLWMWGRSRPVTASIDEAGPLDTATLRPA